MQGIEISLKTPPTASHSVVPRITQELMEQFIILFVVLVFADGEVKTNAEPYPSVEFCQHVEGLYWSQKPEIYEKSNVVGMFTECINIIPRKV